MRTQKCIEVKRLARDCVPTLSLPGVNSKRRASLPRVDQHAAFAFPGRRPRTGTLGRTEPRGCGRRGTPQKTLSMTVIDRTGKAAKNHE